MTAATASQGFGEHFGKALIVRAQDSADSLAAFQDRRCVVEEAGSSSLGRFIRGVLEAPVEVYKFFGSIHLSASDRQCVEMVAGYEADVAAIDASALAKLSRLYPALLEKVRIL